MSRFLLLLLVCYALSLPAQSSFSYVPLDKWDNYVAMDVATDLFVAAGYAGECNYPKITGLDPDTGTLLWEVFPVGFGYGRYVDVTFAPDGSIWASGWIQDSEVGWGSFLALLTHIDKEGNILSHREQEVSQDPFDFKTMLALLPDNRLFWNLGTQIHLVDTSGVSQDSLFSPDDDAFLQISAVSPDFVLASTAFAVYRIGIDGTVETYYTDNDYEVTPRSLITSADRAWWFIGNQLQSFTYATQENHTLMVDTSLYSQPHIYFNEDETITLYSTIEPPFAIGSLNTATNEITDLDTLSAVHRHLYQLQGQEGDYFLLGADLFEGRIGYRTLTHGFAERIYQEETSPRPDIGVSNLEITMDSFSLMQVGPTSFKIRCYFSGMIDVSNYSNITVDSFFVASQAHGGFNCVEGRFNETHSITIAPEETVSVPFYYWAITGGVENAEGRLTAEHLLCLFTGAPNSKLDANPLNNMLCETFILVDTEELLTPSNDLLVFPNPAQHELRIQQEESYLENLKLFDLTGRLMLNQKVEQYDQVEIDISTLAVGQYLLLIQTDQGVHRQQISIQR